MVWGGLSERDHSTDSEMSQRAASSYLDNLGHEKAIELRRIPVTGPGLQGLGLGPGACQDPVLFEFVFEFFFNLLNLNNSEIRKWHPRFPCLKSLKGIRGLAQATPLKSA
jgi:hypothetical protein